MERKPLWEFAPFRLDPNGWMLWHDGQAVALQPRAFSVLCYLVQHAGRLVTKDELLDAVWQHRFVSDSVLKVCINEVRRALSDNVKAPRYIETVARRGYRFIAAPRVIEQGAPVAPSAVPLTVPIMASAQSDNNGILLDRIEWLARLQHLRAQSLAGERQLVFVTGDAGIGKSSLVESFLRTLPAAETAVLTGRCIEHYGAGEAFLPLLEAFERCGRATGGAGLIARLRQWAPTWLAQMPGLVGAAIRADLQQDLVGATRERMLRELVVALEALSQELPLVLVLEDLHWCDVATLDALSLLAQRRDTARLLIIATFRTADAAGSGHPIKRLRQDLLARGHGIDLPLPPFSHAELRNYISAHFPGSDLPAFVVDRVYGRSEGHPLFVATLIDDWTARGLIQADAPRWGLPEQLHESVFGIPERLQAMIEHRFEALGYSEQRLLMAAAAAGAEWSAALVAAALDLDCVVAEECCEALAEHGQLIAQTGISEWPDGTVAACYRFRHSLYRDVLYQGLSAAQRIRFHQRLAARLCTAYGEQSREIAAELANHFERARDYPRAIQHLRQAADNASRRYANREADAYLSRALAISDRLPLAEQADRRIALLRQRVRARSAMDHLSDALADLQLVLYYARKQGDPALVVGTLIEISRMARWLDIDFSLAAAKEAEAISRELDDAGLQLRASVDYAMSSLLFTGWQPETAEVCRKAFATIHRSRDPVLPSPLLHAQAWFECLSSNYELSRQLAIQGKAASQSRKDAYHYMSCWWFELWNLTSLGKFGEARRELTAALDLGEKNANTFALMGFLIGLARLHVESMDYRGARDHCERALRLARADRDHYVRCRSLILLGKAHLGLGDMAATHDYFHAALRLIEDDKAATDWHLNLSLYQGLGEYCLAKGEFAQARAMATKLRELAAPPPERTYLALAQRLLAEIAMAEQDGKRAAAEVDAALVTIGATQRRDADALADTTPLPLAAWRVHLTAAKLLRHQGRPASAAAHRERSRAIVQMLADSFDTADPLHATLTNGYERLLADLSDRPAPKPAKRHAGTLSERGPLALPA